MSRFLDLAAFVAILVGPTLAIFALLTYWERRRKLIRRGK